MAKRKCLSVLIKILSPMDCLLQPRAIYIWWNMKKMYIKLDLKATFFLNLQQMGKVIRAFCWHQNIVPKGLSVIAAGLYTYIKSLKMCIKSDFFFKLAMSGQSDKGFLFTSKVSPQGVLCPYPGAIYICIKSLNVYKIGFWRYHFETCYIWAKRKGLSVIKILSPMCCLPLLWATCVYMIVEKHIKSDSEIVLKLAKNGQSDKGFLLTSTFWS